MASVSMIPDLFSGAVIETGWSAGGVACSVCGLDVQLHCWGARPECHTHLWLGCAAVVLGCM